MLNLQAVNRNALQLEAPGAATSFSGSCGGGSVVFERVVGSLGASVMDEWEPEGVDCDEDENKDENKDKDR